MARYNVDLQDNEGNAYQIMANPDSVAEFSPAVNRENIRSGETYRVIFGKIMKYFSEVGNAAYVGLANNCTTTIAGFALDARQGKELMDRINELNRDLKVVKEHSVWEQIGTLSGTAQKTFDFSQCKEICLVTTCAGNAKLVYTVKIPVIALSEDKIHVCNGGYTAGTGAQCEWEISKTSCRLLACYVGGTNYTASNTVIKYGYIRKMIFIYTTI